MNGGPKRCTAYNDVSRRQIDLLVPDRSAGGSQPAVLRDVILLDHPSIEQGKLMRLQPHYQTEPWCGIALARLASGSEPCTICGGPPPATHAARRTD
jgi:hypothetical protein